MKYCITPMEIHKSIHHPNGISLNHPNLFTTEIDHRVHPRNFQWRNFRPSQNWPSLLTGVHPSDILYVEVHPGGKLDSGRGSEEGWSEEMTEQNMEGKHGKHCFYLFYGKMWSIMNRGGGRWMPGSRPGWYKLHFFFLIRNLGLGLALQFSRISPRMYPFLRSKSFLVVP